MSRWTIIEIEVAIAEMAVADLQQIMEMQVVRRS